MTPESQDPLVNGVRRHQQRNEARMRDGGLSVARRLGQIGVLGWIIVTPMLIGMFGGRWLDHRFGSGLFWTAPLLSLGVGLGCWSAWRWMMSA